MLQHCLLCEEDKPKQETLAIRFATVDNAEAFKAAFLEARQYVLENQARQIREEERGEADGEETPDSDKTAKKEEDAVENEVEEKVEEVKLDGEGKKTATEEKLMVKRLQ